MDEQGPPKQSESKEVIEPPEPPLVGKIRDLWRSESARLGARKFYELSLVYTSFLQWKYDDATRRRAYHALLMSGIRGAQNINEDDFPGEDSVEEVLKNGMDNWKPPIEYLKYLEEEKQRNNKS